MTTSFEGTSDRQRRKSLALLAVLVTGSVLVLIGAAALAVYLARDDQSSPTPSAETGSPAGPAPTSASPGAVQLIEANDTAVGIGVGWPPGEAGAVSAAADYATASTIDITLFELRLALMYADTAATRDEIAQILDDTRRGRANLGVPPGEPPGMAKVQLDAQAVAYRTVTTETVEGYVLVRRELVSYGGDRMPADVLPVPFVVKRLDGDWKLTADPVSWSPPSPSVAAGTEGGWHELLPPH